MTDSHTPRTKRRRPRLFEMKRLAAPGTAPGALRVDPAAPAPSMHVIAFDEHGVDEAGVGAVEELDGWLRLRAVAWINVDGLGDEGVLQHIGEMLGVHRLVLEDVRCSGDVFRQLSAIRGLGGKTQHMVHLLFNETKATLAARAEAIGVAMDLESRRAVPISEARRRSLDRLLLEPKIG